MSWISDGRFNRRISRRRRRRAVRQPISTLYVAEGCIGVGESRIFERGETEARRSRAYAPAHVIVRAATRAKPFSSSSSPAEPSENRKSPRSGPSMVTTVVNSPPDIRPGAAPAGFARWILARHPRAAPMCRNAGRFQRFRRYQRLCATRRLTRLFALIELDVHRRRRRGFRQLAALSAYPLSPMRAFAFSHV